MSIIVIITPPPPPPGGRQANDDGDGDRGRPVHKDYAKARALIDKAEEEGGSVEVREQ